MICRLPPAVHQALVADTARAMARKTPAVAQAAAEIRAEETERLLKTIEPSWASAELHLPSTPRSEPNHFVEAIP